MQKSPVECKVFAENNHSLNFPTNEQAQMNHINPTDLSLYV